MEELLGEAHKRRYRNDRRIQCWERVRVSDPDAEVPEYDRRRVLVKLKTLKRIYGRPYDPDEPVHQPTLLLITPYGIVYIGD